MHKRKWTRVLALLLPLSLCCALMLNLAASGNADAVTPPTDLPYDISGNVEGSPVVERGYTTLLAENNHFLDDNPNRGLRGFIIFTDFPNLTKETIKAQFDEAVNKRFDTAKVPCTTYVVYLYIGEYLQGSRSSASDAAALTLDAAFFEKADYIMQLFRENHSPIGTFIIIIPGSQPRRRFARISIKSGRMGLLKETRTSSKRCRPDLSANTANCIRILPRRTGPQL